MPITNIQQPPIIQINEKLRLRQFDHQFDFAYAWYQDIELVYLVDGIKEAYTFEKLERMYHYLNQHGELYFIEVLENGTFKPIGDVTFSQDDLPIVIGDKNYHGQHIGQKVIASLVQRGKTLGYPKMYVQEIYDYNIASKKCFERVGFQVYEKTKKGYRLEIVL